MNGVGSEQRYVSTFRMHIKPSHVSSQPGNAPGPVDTRTAEKSPDRGKCRMREGEEEPSRV